MSCTWLAVDQRRIRFLIDDRIADNPWFLSSFFGGAKDGLFEAVFVSVGGLAISAFFIAAHYAAKVAA